MLMGVWRNIRPSLWPLGFSHIEGIDYDDTFSPVARYSSIRSIFALSAQMGWHIHQMDVKTVFLNGIIEEDMYIE
jgi:hypothetical protein